MSLHLCSCDKRVQPEDRKLVEQKVVRLCKLRDENTIVERCHEWVLHFHFSIRTDHILQIWLSIQRIDQMHLKVDPRGLYNFFFSIVKYDTGVILVLRMDFGSESGGDRLKIALRSTLKLSLDTPCFCSGLFLTATANTHLICSIFSIKLCPQI